MNQTYEQCQAYMKDLSALSGAMGLLGWDQETMMPKKATEARSEQISALAGVLHERATAKQLGDWLHELRANSSELSADEQPCVREWLRDYEKSVKIPPELAKELAKTTSLSQHAWAEARKKSDFAAFAPWLKKVVDLKRQQADALGYEGVRYDALLDNYEPRMTVKELDPIIEGVRQGLVPIVAAIHESKKKITNVLITKKYPEAQQEKLCREVVVAMGLDGDMSRMDRSTHPFCGGTHATDVRITTRFSEKWLPAALYGAIHEAGHGLYEQGVDPKYYGTPLAESISLGIHESQSRLWENLVGRSEPFSRYLFPKLKKYFPSVVRSANAQKFYEAINTVKPSFIRVEADEVTYNLHVVLRYEIERALIGGDIQVKELPGVWNDKMQTYFGIRPKKDADGVMQDVHWSAGLFGYFPTYLLGNLYAAQWWEKIQKKIPDLNQQIAKGKFLVLREWLRENIHRHGRRYSASELVERVTGKSLTAEPFLAYLHAKYGNLYGIKL
ncbi:MAG: carboxypeptidase M32 [Deltaproteobacteria bacterium]|nr:carboxypeptidase M32 [Deltaproteobacteria bacterium]